MTPLKYFLAILYILAISNSYSQVGIGTTSPDASSVLDVVASDKGILIPRINLVNITTTQLDGTNTAATGLLIYNTNASVVGGNGVGYYMFNGTFWEKLITSASYIQKIDDLLDGKSDSDGTQDGSSVFLGIDAGVNDDSSDNKNVGIGFEVLQANTSGTGNIANGYQALYSNTDGNWNVANGYWSLTYNTSGSANTANGSQSLFSNTDGYNNTANGYQSMYSNTSGADNVASGLQSLYTNTIGTNNTAYGVRSLYLNTEGRDNAATGDRSLFNNTTGRFNTANGSQSLFSNTIGQLNTANGYEALLLNTEGNNNAANGSRSLFSNTTGNDNTANGYRSLYTNTDGDYNAVNGSFSLFFNTTGSHNIGIGYQSLLSNTTGSFNIGVGGNTGASNSTGSNNIYLGHSAGTSETGSNKLYIENSNANADNALIYGEFDTNILRTNSQFQIGNPSSTGFAFPIIDGTVNQVMQTDGTGTLSWVDSSTIGSNDADWFEEGTTNAPNDINDDIFTQGNVAIGKNTADYALDIEEAIDTIAVRVKMINSSNTDNYGLYIENSSSGTGYHYGQYTLMEGTGTNGLFATYNRIENAEMGSHFGTVNSLGGDGIGRNYGTYNTLFGSGDGIQYGSYQILKQHGDGVHYGTYSTLYGNGNGAQLGSKILLNATGTGDKYGVSNQLGGGTGTYYGVHNLIHGGGNQNNVNPKYGVYNGFDNPSFSMNGTLYGVYNSFDPTINGFGYSKYGVYTYIPVTVPGINYGIYCDVTRFDSYAGYFLGRVSIGTTTTNNYILPQSRGTDNQIMQTNATGNVSWVNSSTVGTDNQNISGSGLTGTNLTIGIENGISEIIDLASLQDGVGTDDQNISGSGLSGTTLTIGIENGTSETVDLSSLQDGTGTDDQNLTGAILTGNTLQIDIENGTSTSVDLSALNTGGDITNVTAGTGLTGGGNSGAVTLNVIASNGVTANANDIVLGGTLNQDTTIAQGGNNMIFDLNGTGDFFVQDNGINHFEVRSTGDAFFGSDTNWMDQNTGGTILAKLYDTGSGDDGAFQIYRDGTVQHVINSSGTTTFNELGLDFDFRIEGLSQTNLFRIDAGNDRIGILKGVPSFDLHLKQSTNTQNGAGGIGFENSANSNNWKIYHDGSNLSFAENGTRRGYITAGTGLYMPTSDRRLKKSITEVESILDKVNTLKAYHYLYKDQEISAKKTIGFMAQDVQLLFPELVGQAEDGFFALNYSGFGVLAIKAIQEQQDIIDSMRTKIDTQEEKIKSVENLLSLLLERVETLENNN